MNKMNLFLREVEFYEHMASNGPHSAHFPYQFIAPYHGVILGENICGKRTPYLALEDISKNYRVPCMMDIKMGRETFEPTASLDKMIREKIKYKYQEKIGFRICGFKVYDSLAQVYHSVGKKFGRSLTPELVEHGLAAFFHNGLGHFRIDVLEQLVQKLELLLQWLLKQNKWHFYCSSLLITYDAEAVARSARVRVLDDISLRHFLLCCVDGKEEGECSREDVTRKNSFNTEVSSDHEPISTTRKPSLCQQQQQRLGVQRHPSISSTSHNHHQDLVDVRMIDHAHTLESPGSSDDSYIYSLKSLIRHLESIIFNIHGAAASGTSYCEPSILIADALSLSFK
jgi:1D-myo-inositol-tetrakisphosphate 5-kinase/inositol-polyphosphate multikinase